MRQAADGLVGLVHAHVMPLQRQVPRRARPAAPMAYAGEAADTYRQHMGFLKRVFGVKRSTRSELVLREAWQ